MASAKPSEGASPLVEMYCTGLSAAGTCRLFKLLIRHVNLPAKMLVAAATQRRNAVTLIAKRMASQASQSGRARNRHGPRCKPSAVDLRPFCLRDSAARGECPNPKH